MEPRLQLYEIIITTSTEICSTDGVADAPRNHRNFSLKKYLQWNSMEKNVIQWAITASTHAQNSKLSKNYFFARRIWLELRKILTADRLESEHSIDSNLSAKNHNQSCSKNKNSNVFDMLTLFYSKIDTLLIFDPQCWVNCAMRSGSKRTKSSKRECNTVGTFLIAIASSIWRTMRRWITSWEALDKQHLELIFCWIKFFYSRMRDEKIFNHCFVQWRASHMSSWELLF